MNKEALRKIYKNKRQELDGHQRLKLDDLLLIRFQEFDFSHIRVVLSYWPMANQSEPNTHLFTGYLRHMVPGLQMAYPVTDMEQINITAYRINEDTVYTTNRWGITEPPAVDPLEPQQVDLVLVPMLICDQKGYRVGYGKGFYDRFLAQCRTDVVKMGFSYFDPVPRITDTHEFDVPLNYCITPKDIYEF